MSTSANLPAGFSLTSINGARCTAVPRTATVLTGSLATEASSLLAALAATSVQSTTQVLQTTTAAVISTTSTSVPAATVVATTASITSISSIPSTSISTSTTSSVTEAVAQPSAVQPISTFITSASSITSSKSSISSVPVAQSEVHFSTVKLSTSTTSDASKTTSASIAVSTIASGATAATSGIASKAPVRVASLVGGVFGGIALIGLIGLLLWFFRRRRRHNRESLLTPLTIKRESEFYEIDRGSVGPTGFGSKIRQKLGARSTALGSTLKTSFAGIKSKVLPTRSDTPSVNLNRGNSQFLDGPIPQHSRNNSMLSSHSTNLTLKERIQDLYERLTEKFHANRRSSTLSSQEFFASARSLNEKKAQTVNPPDFSQLLGMEDRELHLANERRHLSNLSSGSNNLNLNSLDLNFNSTLTKNATNPFADPKNPFLDPPPPTQAKSSTNYVHQIRHSRGQSIATDSQNPNGNSKEGRIPSSRYPSTIISFRDTIFSKKTAGRRSDPFDLERPELWRPDLPTNSLVPDPLASAANPTSNPNQGKGKVGNGEGSGLVGLEGGVGRDSFTSKYSSGLSVNLGNDMWGDPGPDVTPGSVENGSLKDFMRRGDDGSVRSGSPVSSLGVGKAR